MFTKIVHPESESKFFVCFSGSYIEYPTLLSYDLCVLCHRPCLARSEEGKYQGGDIQGFRVESCCGTLLDHRDKYFAQCTDGGLQTSQSEEQNDAYYCAGCPPYLNQPVVPSREVTHDAAAESVVFYFLFLLAEELLQEFIICFRHNRPVKAVALSDLHIREMFVISTGLLMLMYVINYGKVLDWMASGKVCAYIIIAPMLIALFIWYQSHSEKPYVSLAPLFQAKAIVGYLYMMLVMFFSTSTTLLTNYLTIILKVDTTHTYSLYIYLLPGYIVGAFICFWWFRWQRWRFRFLIAGGMSCFVIFFGILYFGISPNSTYEMLYLPLFFRGLGMLTLIIAFALFAVEDLNPKFLLSNAFFLIIFRSVLTPIMATSFYSNVLYRLEQKYMYSLSETITTADPLAASRYSQSLNNALAQGHGNAEAAQLATNSLYTTLQQQSLLLALKEILGYLLVISIIIAVVSRFIPFHKTLRVTFKRTGDDMV